MKTQKRKFSTIANSCFPSNAHLNILNSIPLSLFLQLRTQLSLTYHKRPFLFHLFRKLIFFDFTSLYLTLILFFDFFSFFVCYLFLILICSLFLILICSLFLILLIASVGFYFLIQFSYIFFFKKFYHKNHFNNICILVNEEDSYYNNYVAL